MLYKKRPESRGAFYFCLFFLASKRAIKTLADTFSISTAQATQLADAGFLTVDGILETDEADFAAATGLDDVTATGIYAAAQAVAALIGEGEE